MVFASLVFLYVFLPLNLLLYYAFRNKVYRNVILILFSFVFYAWGEPIWIILLIFSATLDYFNGRLVEKRRGKRGAKLGVILSVILNISLLGLFKYSGWLYENVNFVFSANFDPPSFSLPIGISFYTFQTISYVIDVYRNDVKAERSFMRFLMFVSLYHQLVAGPIVRYAHIAHEIDHRRFDIKDISQGIARFCIGLFKKVAIANVAGQLVGQYMSGSPLGMNMGESWFAITMFSIQIYFDFSGYSDMAIGLGRMFGFHYHENFKYPYISRTATEFWRRWHISLGTFFRDYIYIPLGGSRKRPILNLFIIWGLTGLWHGASWNFVLWGLFYGVLIFFERMFLNKLFEKIPAIISHLYLLFFTLIGWTLFYYTDTSYIIDHLKIMFGVISSEKSYFDLINVMSQNFYWILIALILCMPVYPWVMKKLNYDPDNGIINTKVHLALIFASMVLFIISTTMLVGNSYNPFLYFRF